MSNGKGSKRRLSQVPDKVLSANWDSIFGKKQPNKTSKKVNKEK